MNVDKKKNELIAAATKLAAAQDSQQALEKLIVAAHNYNLSVYHSHSDSELSEQAITAAELEERFRKKIVG